MTRTTRLQRSTWTASRATVLALWVVACGAGVAQAQAPAPSGAPTNVEVDPVTCWWKTDTASVRVGQVFGVTLTCSLLDAEATRVVLDEARLDPRVAQLPPFDVVSGDRANDVVTPGRRFLQYRYDVRLVAENAFGTEVLVPPLQLSYRIESRIAGASDAARGDALQGRELAYALPPIALRVQSMVPNSAMDIREAPVVSFDAIAATSLRARALKTTAIILFIVAGLLAAIAVVRWAWSRRTARAARTLTLRPAAALAAARRDLKAVENEAGGGWTPALQARALAALRLAGSYAAGDPVSLREATAGADALEGQVAVRGMRGPRVFVSGAATPARLGDDARHGDLREALTAFTAARFGRPADGAASLDDALSQAQRGVATVAADHAWHKEAWRRMQASLSGAWGRAWAR